MGKNSELIINPGGSIYHLNLLPEDIADTIITVGDQHRVGEVSRYFDRIEIKKKNREFVTHTGYIGSRRLSVISTGIGTDNVDIVLNELHILTNVNMETGEPVANKRQLDFIRLGTSGTIQEDIPVGTILASSGALGFDGLLHFYEGAKGQEEVEELLKISPGLRVLPAPYFAYANDLLLQHFAEAYQMKGITVTAPGFYAPQGRSVNLPVRVKDFIQILSRSNINGMRFTNIEMETAGIYGLAGLLGHRAISLSAILANRLSGEFSQDPRKVIQQLILGVLRAL